jgi:hypothetical protein
MSTDAWTEEYRISGAVLPVPRRTSQLPPLPIQNAPTCSFRNAPLAAHAKDCDCPSCLGNGLTVETRTQTVAQLNGVNSDRTPHGSFAAHQMVHSATPLLIVRPGQRNAVSEGQAARVSAYPTKPRLDALTVDRHLDPIETAAREAPEQHHIALLREYCAGDRLPAGGGINRSGWWLAYQSLLSVSARCIQSLLRPADWTESGRGVAVQRWFCTDTSQSQRGFAGCSQNDAASRCDHALRGLQYADCATSPHSYSELLSPAVE